jgi:tetratricopeptide (TPR) repeat protein
LKYVSIHKKAKHHDLDLADVLQSIGQVFDIQQDYHKAIEYYQKSLEIKE